MARRSASARRSTPIPQDSTAAPSRYSNTVPVISGSASCPELGSRATATTDSSAALPSAPPGPAAHAATSTAENGYPP